MRNENKKILTGTKGMVGQKKKMIKNEVEERKEKEGGGKVYLSPELIAQIAEYCSARDQLSIRSLCKGIKAILPQIIQLNLKYYIESCTRIMNSQSKAGLIENRMVHFKLNRLVVEKEPFSILEFMHTKLFKPLSSSSDTRRTFTYGTWSKSLRDFMDAITFRVLQLPKHPKFDLLTLPIAASANCVPALQFLLLPSNRSKIPNTEYHFALCSACTLDCPEALKVLLDLQSPLSNPSHSDNWPIQLAAREGNTRCVQLLLRDHRVNPADVGNLAIRLSAQYGHLDAFLLLHQDERVDPSDCIILAAEKGHLSIFTVLLQDQRVNAASENDACIKYSSQNGHTAIVRLLLADQRVDPTASENEALRRACTQGHTEVARLLLDDIRVGGSPDENAALKSALSKGLLEVVALMDVQRINRMNVTLTRSGRKSTKRIKISTLPK